MAIENLQPFGGNNGQGVTFRIRSNETVKFRLQGTADFQRGAVFLVVPENDEGDVRLNLGVQLNNGGLGTMWQEARFRGATAQLAEGQTAPDGDSVRSHVHIPHNYIELVAGVNSDAYVSIMYTSNMANFALVEI